MRQGGIMKKNKPMPAPLHDQNAEKVILSTVLLKEAALIEAMQYLKVSDFYNISHGIIFSAIQEAVQKGLAPDLIIVNGILKNKNADDALYSLIDLSNIPATVNHSEIIRQIIEYSRKRELLNRVELIIENISHPLKCSDGIISDLRSITQELNYNPCQNTCLITIADLLDKEFPEPRFIIPGIIPEGNSVVTSAPKGGKSHLVLDIMTSLSLGVPVLGIETTPQKTLYLALEDTQRRLKNRIERQNVGDIRRSTNCVLTTQWKTGAEGLLELHNYIQAEKPKLIAVDTLGVFSRMKDFKDYSETTDIMTGLKNLSHENNTSIILVHHTRKSQAGSSDDDFLERTLGSQGITGGADTILNIAKKRNSEDAILSITGRDVEEQELAIRFNKVNCRWELLGKSYEVADSAQRQEIINLLKSEGSLTPSEIAENLNKNKSTVRTLLQKLSESGHIKKQEISGRYKINDEIF